MNIQFSIVGMIIILLFYGVCAGLLVLLAFWIKEKRYSWIVVSPLAVIALALPWVDEVWIAWHFKEICKDAGVHVIRKVEVEGFLDDTTETHRNPPSAQAIGAYEKGGYRFYERRSRDKYVVREKIADQWRTSIHDQPTARYHFRKPTSDADVGRAISCSEDVIVDSHTNQTIARYRYCKRYASVPERIWLGLVHRGPTQYCPAADKALKGMLYSYVLIPGPKRQRK